MDEITVPIYFITGFLESGKTSFLSFTLQQDYFRTLMERHFSFSAKREKEEYDEEALAKKDNVVVEVIEKEEDFTTESALGTGYHPSAGACVIEYNGMWLVSNLRR